MTLPRPATIIARAVVATLAAAALTGCGDDEERATAPADGVRLTITVRDDADAEPRIVVVDCAPGDTDAPCPAAATLRAEDFAPTPGDAVCSQQYGGPEEAMIEGAVDGAPVRATVTRTDGCEIARWEQLVAPLT
jgi:hypothetical protein